MKTRILVAVVAIPILVLIILLAPVWVLGVLVGGIAAGAAWELLRCTETDMPLRMRCYGAAAAFCIPFLTVFFPAARVYEIALIALFMLCFCELMLSFRKETTMALESVTSVLLAGGIMPVLLSGLVRLGLRENGAVYALLPFVVTFSTDSGAYFAGLGLGRHKLAPHLSPNKTIEGSIGGFVAGIAFALLYGVVLRACGFEVKMPVMASYGFLGALACQLGDLGFSAVKRLCGVKDYGNLIAGHGGMLDRFDSMFWTAALLELLVAWVPAITK